MAPSISLPICADFTEVEEYVESLLQFATTSTLFQTFCGGVHILDFFTQDPSLYDTVIPQEWRPWLMAYGSMELLNLLMRDDLDEFHRRASSERPPHSLVQYIRDVRRHSLGRSFTHRPLRQTTFPRQVSVGMTPKKIHEVTNFADYVVSIAENIDTMDGHGITHFVDFGSGQNYLGRALASPPYNKHIVGVESKELNINGAKSMDVIARLAKREIVPRNKKLYHQKLEGMIPTEQLKDRALLRAARPEQIRENVADLRPSRDLATIYTPGEGKGSIQYVEHVVHDGDLVKVVQQITNIDIIESYQSSLSDTNGTSLSNDEKPMTGNSGNNADPRLMAISVHSCGNLSHHGIRSLLLNQSVKAIAIVGCCYNLLTERLGPPTYKLPMLRPYLRPINARVARESAACDPHGFPMSERIANYNGDGIRLNITARMMAVQAPWNWTEKESDAFFTRHFFRALLQRVFLDRGVVSKPQFTPKSRNKEDIVTKEGTDPVIIGSLRKGCYNSFTAYVRGAIAKLTTDSDRGTEISIKMASITDEEIEEYCHRYSPRKKELSVMWSLMAFSAGVVESLIVVDRWQYLREHPDVVKDCWVEAVFDYRQSPRNLVVVGIKK